MIKLTGLLKESIESATPEELLDLVRDLVGYHSSIEYATPESDSDSFEQGLDDTLQKIKLGYGSNVAEMTNDLASLIIYHDEYAGPEESRAVYIQMKTLANDLNLDLDDIMNFS